MGIDWTTTDRCERCNVHGPWLESGLLYDPERARDGHQAWRSFVAAILDPIGRLLERVKR